MLNIIICALVFFSSSVSAASGHLLNASHSSSHHTQNAKQGAPVKLLSPHLMVVPVNQRVSLNLQLATQAAAGKLTIQLSASPQLQVNNSTITYPLDTKNTAAITLPVTVNAAAAGRYYLNLDITLNDGQIISSRVLSVIVQAGEPRKKAASLPLKQQKNAGDLLISMPAEETIHSQ